MNPGGDWFEEEEVARLGAKQSEEMLKERRGREEEADRDALLAWAACPNLLHSPTRQAHVTAAKWPHGHFLSLSFISLEKYGEFRIGSSLTASNALSLSTCTQENNILYRHFFPLEENRSSHRCKSD